MAGDVRVSEHRSWFRVDRTSRSVKNALYLLEGSPYMSYDAALDTANLIKKHLDDALACLEADVFIALREHGKLDD